MKKSIKLQLITVGVPTYNRADTYLKAALDSVLAQTYKNFELVVSDNASTDDTQKICEEYVRKDERVRYIRHKANIGPTANFNVLRREARGDCFMQLCDDDLLAPTFLEKCLAVLTNYPGAVVAIPNFVEFDDEKREVNFHPKLYIPSAKNLYARLKQYILFYEDDGKDRLMWGLWRRDAITSYMFDERPFPDPPGWDFLDMDFVFQGLILGTCSFVDGVLFYKRASPKAFDSPRKKAFVRRLFDSIMRSRLHRLFKPFFYRRMKAIWCSVQLSFTEKIKLTLWNLFVMSRLFWKRKI